jgi:hypothetical protein
LVGSTRCKPPAGQARDRLEAIVRATVDWFIVSRKALNVHASDRSAIEEGPSHSTIEHDRRSVGFDAHQRPIVVEPSLRA